jgi:hypothetical protein
LLEKQDQLLTINSNPNQEVLEMGIPWGALIRMLLGRGARGGKLVSGLPSASRTVRFTTKQLQKKFDHAPAFGVIGNQNAANLARFQSAIEAHVNNPAIRAIQGTYRTQPVNHFVDPHSGLNVMTTRAGDFISGWKLNSAQLTNVLSRGSL